MCKHTSRVDAAIPSAVSPLSGKSNTASGWLLFVTIAATPELAPAGVLCGTCRVSGINDWLVTWLIIPIRLPFDSSCTGFDETVVELCDTAEVGVGIMTTAGILNGTVSPEGSFNITWTDRLPPAVLRHEESATLHTHTHSFNTELHNQFNPIRNLYCTTHTSPAKTSVAHIANHMWQQHTDTEQLHLLVGRE